MTSLILGVFALLMSHDSISCVMVMHCLTAGTRGPACTIVNTQVGWALLSTVQWMSAALRICELKRASVLLLMAVRRPVTPRVFGRIILKNQIHWRIAEEKCRILRIV
jgi:hypothetical protein